MVGTRRWPPPSPTLNNSRGVGVLVKATTPLAASPSLAPLVLDLGQVSAQHLAQPLALPGSDASSLDRTNLRPAPDLSPIRWRVRVTGVEGRTLILDGLCDDGAHGVFLAEDKARELGLEFVPVSNSISVRLPTGATVPINHRTRPVTIEIDRQYKGDVSFLILPLQGVGLILGTPWLYRHGATTHHADKTVSFHHRGRDVKLFPANPVFPPSPIEPLQTASVEQGVAPTTTSPRRVRFACPLERPLGIPATTPVLDPARPRLRYPSRQTHLPSHTETKTFCRELRARMAASRAAFDQHLSVLEEELGAPKQPSSPRSLSSFNVCEHVEFNTAPRFERAVLEMDPLEALDCGVLYVKGTGGEDLEISNLPFPQQQDRPYSDAATQLLFHMSPENLSYAQEVALFSVNPAAAPPMASLPSTPVLSVQQYLEGIKDRLDAHGSSLYRKFGNIVSAFAEDVFPDPPRLRLGPKRPEDMRIIEEPGTRPLQRR